MTLRASLLHSVPAGDPGPGPEPAEAPASEPENAPQKANTVAHAWRTAGSTWREGAKREGGWVNAALRWRGPSVADQQDYLRNRAWLDQGHEEGLADRAGEAYHAGIAIPAVAALNGAKAAVSRPFVAAWAAVVVLPALFFGLRMAGTGGREAAVVCGALIVAPLAYVAVIMLALAARRERQRKKEVKK